MKTDELNTDIYQFWDQNILPTLQDYIKIPNISPLFEPEWEKLGHMEEAIQLLHNWSIKHAPASALIELIRLPGRTPMLFIEIPGQDDRTTLLYGHMDKQPPMEGWREGLSPWEPVIKNERLYGRGGADDGYALFSCIAALKALADHNIDHSRCLIMIEASEESGSPDLPAYMEHLAKRLGEPELVICLDSGCGNYEQLWLTTSLRGLIGGKLTVDVLNEGVHSGDAGGIVPDSFRIVRQLLNRLEDPATGEIRPADFHVEIPSDRLAQSEQVASALGNGVYTRFPFSDDTEPQGKTPFDCVINRTWKPALTVIGADGLPACGNAGNVHRPSTSVSLSLRLPPTCNAEEASKKLHDLLVSEPPHRTRINFEADWAATGWQSPPLADWLENALKQSSLACFGKPALLTGEGFSIPFMNMLGERYPQAQFVITGVLGPGSNAHGPNEFMHIPMAKKLTACVSRLLAAHHQEVHLS